MKIVSIIGALICILLLGVSAFAHTSYTGYSSAPGSRGSCASSCHGSSGGTIQISGFPEQYEPGQTYTITISHAGGNSIRQFNGSCRLGTGSQNAGEIAGGTNTVTYNTSGETNGVHFLSSNLDSGTFDWTAPADGASEVRLYIAGLQGNYGGQNTELQLVADELVTGIDEKSPSTPLSYSLADNYPNPFNASTTIGFELPVQSQVVMDIFDVTGRKVATLFNGIEPAGYHRLTWSPGDVSSGVYFYRLQTGEYSESKKLIFLK